MNTKMNKLFCMMVVLFSLAACMDDTEYTTGVWYRRSDFDDMARTDAAGFTIGNVGYLCTGYRRNTKDHLKDYRVYGIEANSWTQCASMPGVAPVRNTATGFAVGTKGYTATGYDAAKKDYLNDYWQYDPTTNSWKEMTSIPDGTDGTNIYGKRYYALPFGIGQYGYLDTGYNDDYQRDLRELGPSVGNKGEQAAMGEFGGQKRTGSMAFIIDDIACICGGENNGSDVTDLWCFSPATGTWKELREFYDKSDGGYDDDYTSIARSYACAFVIDGKGYIAAGRTAGGNYRSNYWIYGPLTDLWDGEDLIDFEGNTRSKAVCFSTRKRGIIATGGASTYYYDDAWELKPYEYKEE